MKHRMVKQLPRKGGGNDRTTNTCSFRLVPQSLVVLIVLFSPTINSFTSSPVNPFSSRVVQSNVESSHGPSSQFSKRNSNNRHLKAIFTKQKLKNECYVSASLPKVGYKTTTSLASAVADPGQDTGGLNDDPKQNIPSAVFSLVKACVGAGVLSLPRGVAAIGDNKSALIPSVILVFVVGVLSAYTFFNIGRDCHIEGEASTMGEAWEKEFGPKFSWIVNLSCLLTALGAVLSYSILIGDTFSSLAKFVGMKGVLSSRHASILAITLPILYPLCSLQSLSALAPVSIAGVIGIMFTCIFMAVRAISGSYSPGGAHFSQILPAFQPSFGAEGMKSLLTPSSVVLSSITATGYLVHFSAADFYQSLENNSMRRFGTLTILGFTITALISTAIMALGFLTFGSASAGMILNNYSANDKGAIVSRLLMSLSVIASYPFLFLSAKKPLAEFITKDNKIGKTLNKKITRVTLAAITCLALVIKDAGFVVSFNGALMGSAIIYIFPSLIFLSSTKKRIVSGDLRAKSKRVFLERFFNKLLIVLGVGFGVTGAIASVLSSFYPHLL